MGDGGGRRKSEVELEARRLKCGQVAYVGNAALIGPTNLGF